MGSEQGEPSLSTAPGYALKKRKFDAKFEDEDSDTPEYEESRSYLVKDKQSLEYVIKSGIAGGLAGSAAKTLIAPLDRVKILFQTANPEFKRYVGSWTGFYKAGKHIIHTEGPWGLFRGHSATLLRIFPYAGIKFIAYEQVRHLLIPSAEYETSLRRLLAGSISGVCSVFCTYPLDLIRVRLAYGIRSGEQPGIKTRLPPRGRLFDTISHVYREPPRPGLPRILNFYSGFTATVLGMIPYAGVSFWAHDTFHDMFRSQWLRSIAVDYSIPEKDLHSTGPHHRPLNTWAQLCAGGLSGLLAQTASYPLEVVRRRMQVSGAVTGAHTKIMATVRQILLERGIPGLFVGLSIGYIKVVPMFACSFFVYERAKQIIGI